VKGSSGFASSRETESRVKPRRARQRSRISKNPLKRYNGRSFQKTEKSYSVLMACIGQDLAHLPHPVHFSLSTTAIPWSFKDTAPAGHSSTQAPQPMHLFSSTLAGINLAIAYAEPTRRQTTASATSNLVCFIFVNTILFRSSFEFKIVSCRSVLQSTPARNDI